MNRYLAITFDGSGRWTSGSLSQAYVFEADDNHSAAKVMASYLKDRNAIEVSFLGRITGGLRVEKIQTAVKLQDSEVPELSHRRQQELGFNHLFIGEQMITQLQPFSPEEKKDRLAAIKGHERKERADEKKVAAMPLPRVGDNIYVPSALYLSHGRDDVMGGLAKVRSITKQMSGGKPVHFISVKEIPGNFNWEQSLALKQGKLRKEFGRLRARPNPDNHPSANEP